MSSAGTYLDDGLPASNFEDLTLSGLTVSELDVDDLSIPIEEAKG